MLQTANQTTNFKMTKAAWIRNENAPAGERALGRLNCSCGKAPESRYCEKGGDYLIWS